MHNVSRPVRWAHLDVVSGVMVLHMIVGHALQRSGIWSVDGTCYAPVRLALFFFMPWFYFKAGLFVSRRRSVGQCVVKDARRLLLPFVVWTAVGSAVAVAMELAGGEARVWWKLLGSPLKSVVVHGSAGGGLHLWFLLSLFWVRCAYRLLPARCEWPAMAVALVAGWLLCRCGVRLPLSWSTVFPGLVMLLAGVRCRPWMACGDDVAAGGRALTAHVGGGKLTLIVCFVAGLLLLAPGMDMRVNGTTRTYVLTYVLAVMGCLSAGWLAAWLERRAGGAWLWRALAWSGRQSMVLYVVHWLPLMVGSWLMELWWPEAGSAVRLCLLLSLVVLTVVAVLRLRRHLPAWLFGE